MLAPVVFAVPLLVDVPGLEPPGERMLAIFLLAIVLWVTEAIPLYATAAVIIAAEIALVSDEAIVPLPAAFDPPAFASFYEALAHPVLLLFLGGFFLADGAAKFALDRNLAAVLLRPFRGSPRGIMLGLMVITAVLSMFMSNTATTATMMAVVLPVTAGLARDDRLRTGLVLAIPVAANVGGLGTPVGTPPNAIALGGLVEAGVPITFVQWMAMTLPFMLVVLACAWLLLGRLFPASASTLRFDTSAAFDRSRPAVVFYATFAMTVLLWLTEPLHGVPATVIGFVPVVVLLATRVFGATELRGVRWDVLWLVAGGLALATGVGATGLDAWLIGLVAWQALPTPALLAALAGIGLVLSTVISNSATANLLVPLGITLALSPAVATAPLTVGVLIAVGCSLAMSLPVSTPPNAIAYSTGAVRTRDLVVTGGLLGVGGVALVVLAGPPLWSWLGLLP